MIETLLTVLPSVLWILCRIYKLLEKPVCTLFANLNLAIPQIPLICIDAVTKSSVFIHWDIQVDAEEELIYVILVNNREVATVNTKSCKLNHLQLNKVYQIEVVAINVATNFISKSAPVYIETLLTDGLENKFKELPFLNENSIKDTDGSLVSKADDDIVFTDETFQITSANTKIDISNVSTPITLSHLTPQQIKLIENPQELNYYLVTYQEELSKTIQEHESFYKNLNVELQNLKHHHEIYKKEFNEESDSKLRLENSIKDIEKKRDNLNFVKSKLQNQLKQLKSTSHLHESKLDSLQLEYTKCQEKSINLKQKLAQESNSLSKKQENLKQEIERYKKINDQLESEIKFLTNEKKSSEKLLQTIKPLMEMFGSESNFTREGTLKPNSQAAMNTLFEMIPEWKQEILEELDKTRSTELEWRHVYKSEIRKFLTLKNNLEMMKASRNKNYQPQKMTEYQASLEFGGYNHALSKLNNGNHKPKSTKGKNSTFNPSIYSDPSSSSNTNSNVHLDLSNNSNLNSSSTNMNTNQSSNSQNDLGWQSYYTQVYSNDNSFDNHDSQSPVGEVVNKTSRVGSPDPQIQINNLPSATINEPTVSYTDPQATNMQMQNSLLSDSYYSYPSLSNNLWIGSQNSSNYVGLNSLGYGSNEHFYSAGGNPSGGISTPLQGNVSGTLPGSGSQGSKVGVSSQGAFSEFFQTSLNHSGTNLQATNNNTNDLNSLRNQILSQRLDIPSAQQYIPYKTRSPVPTGLEGFLMSPSASGPGLLDTQAQNPPNLMKISSDGSQTELLNDAIDPYSTSLSPQIAPIQLNKSNLWASSPYGHTRNISNNSQSQLWRTDSTPDVIGGMSLSEVNLLRKSQNDEE